MFTNRLTTTPCLLSSFPVIEQASSRRNTYLVLGRGVTSGPFTMSTRVSSVLPQTSMRAPIAFIPVWLRGRATRILPNDRRRKARSQHRFLEPSGTRSQSIFDGLSAFDGGKLAVDLDRTGNVSSF
jgi:hypothetical protein